MAERRRRRRDARIVPEGQAHIQATFNNTIVTITDPQGNAVCWSSGGSVGFKGSRKSTPYAAQMTSEQAARQAMDMGMRAKSLKSMMRLLTYKAARTGTTILFANHTYDDPGAMFPTLVKSQAGGKGPIYLASVLVQLASRNEKQDSANEKDDMLPEAKKYSGTTLRALTIKNRFVPPFLECEMYLNFKTGLDKYAGLKDVAVNHGVIEQNGATFTMDGNKLGYYKNWRKDKELWKKILPKLEEVLQEKYCYGN